ncbi:MAG: hypothetical protein UV19_C0014G0008 [Parcubacteria group bacterium GW2011_GWA2_42_28]|nr:MAG: hypothetical protein UV19_C0014G0008 [Parcubacteria group bacterium GW2011_GWA2_42_28]
MGENEETVSYTQRLLEHLKTLKEGRLQRARQTRGEWSSMYAEVTALMQSGEIEQARKILNEDMDITKEEIEDLQQHQGDVQRIIDQMEGK